MLLNSISNGSHVCSSVLIKGWLTFQIQHLLSVPGSLVSLNHIWHQKSLDYALSAFYTWLVSMVVCPFYRTPFCHCHVHFLLSFICNEFQHIHICIFLQILGVPLSRPQWVAVSWFLHVVWFPWKTFATVRSLSFWRLSDKLRYLKPPTSLYLIISSCCTPYCQMAYRLPRLNI